jgi:two-component system, NarL family, response regulator NreC
MRRHLRAVSDRSSGGVPAVGPIRVVLADNHAAMRRSLRLLLEREEDLMVVAEADDFEGALRQVGEYRPDVLVVDLRMPDGSSLERIRALRERLPGTEIVAITMHTNQLFAEQAGGALGLVLKDIADAELCDAVRRAARGVRYRSPRVKRP